MGIYSLFNLIRMAQEKVEKNLLKYVATNVVWIGMKGVLFEQNSEGLFKGYNSTLVEEKKKLNVSIGGTPWMDNLITFIKLDNKAEIKNN